MTTTFTKKQIRDLGRLTKTIELAAIRKDAIRDKIEERKDSGKPSNELTHEEKFYANIVEFLFDYGIDKYGDKFDKAVKLPK